MTDNNIHSTNLPTTSTSFPVVQLDQIAIGINFCTHSSKCSWTKLWGGRLCGQWEKNGPQQSTKKKKFDFFVKDHQENEWIFLMLMIVPALHKGKINIESLMVEMKKKLYCLEKDRLMNEWILLTLVDAPALRKGGINIRPWWLYSHLCKSEKYFLSFYRIIPICNKRFTPFLTTSPGGGGVNILTSLQKSTSN